MGRFRLLTILALTTAATSMVSVDAFAQASTSRNEGKNDVMERRQGGVSPQPPAGRHPIPAPTPGKPEIFFCDTPETACRTTADSFVLDEVRDLYVFVVWPGARGSHTQTLQFLLPDGAVYLAKQTRFVVGAIGAQPPAPPVVNPREVSPPAPAAHLTADANRVHPEGIPSLLTVSRGESTVLTVLPVGGTYITQRNFAGTWHVRVFLDEQPAFESDFTLTSRRAPPEGREGRESREGREGERQ